MAIAFLKSTSEFLGSHQRDDEIKGKACCKQAAKDKVQHRDFPGIASGAGGKACIKRHQRKEAEAESKKDQVRHEADTSLKWR
ncbi:hypothetical protein ACRC7T_16840 [Segnochrobactraceae bacterium EtOH-i3]